MYNMESFDQFLEEHDGDAQKWWTDKIEQVFSDLLGRVTTPTLHANVATMNEN